MATRLQFGAKSLRDLDPKVLPVFLNKTWVHLGADLCDERIQPSSRSIPPLREVFRRHSIGYILKTTARLIRRKRIHLLKKSQDIDLKKDQIFRLTNFQEFYYRKGDILEFSDNSIDFVFSEHFFEHLFFDEALSLLRESHRILKDFGVIRTCVPDADLRTYEAPESVGWPDRKLPYTHPDKHKSRWSVYSLSELLKVAGFKPVPLRYCDKHGNYNRIHPAHIKQTYYRCPDPEVVFTLDYVSRKNSLIIDGIKMPDRSDFTSGPSRREGDED